MADKLSIKKKIFRIKKAVEITEKGLKAVRRYLRPGITERMLAAKIEFVIRRSGADWFSFPTIVSAHNFKKIHSTPTDYKIKKSDTVIVDVGAVYKGCCADITRTFCLNPSKKVSQLHLLVKRAQNIASSELYPGVDAKHIDKIARDVLKKAGYCMPHGIGHGIGVKVHEKPIINKRSKDKLKEGQVVTIEPGIYLNSLGIRIEDMYLITKTGAKRLTTLHTSI